MLTAGAVLASALLFSAVLTYLLQRVTVKPLFRARTKTFVDWDFDKRKHEKATRDRELQERLRAYNEAPKRVSGHNSNRYTGAKRPKVEPIR
jgi:hypothetical protein